MNSAQTSAHAIDSPAMLQQSSNFGSYYVHPYIGIYPNHSFAIGPSTTAAQHATGTPLYGYGYPYHPAMMYPMVPVDYVVDEKSDDGMGVSVSPFICIQYGLVWKMFNSKLLIHISRNNCWSTLRDRLIRKCTNRLKNIYRISRRLYLPKMNLVLNQRMRNSWWGHSQNLCLKSSSYNQMNLSVSNPWPYSLHLSVPVTWRHLINALLSPANSNWTSFTAPERICTGGSSGTSSASASVSESTTTTSASASNGEIRDG